MASTARAPKQWCLTKVETVTSFESWRQNLQYVLALDPNFATLLQEQTSWKKKSRNDPYRGFEDDGDDVPEGKRKTAAQKVTILELMLGQIANYCPVISRNTIVKNSTSISNIWQSIRLHYGFQSTGAHFLDLAEIRHEPNERPEDLFQRITAFIDDSLITKDSGITHHGEKLDDDEELSPTLENMIVLHWLTLIHKDLPRLVKQRYGTELRARSLASLKPEISQALDSLLEEIRSSHDARIMPAAAQKYTSKYKPSLATHRSDDHEKNNKVCCLCKAANRPNTDHFLSKCPYLPPQDRKYIVRSRTLTVDDESDDNEPEVHFDHLALEQTPNTNLARRVEIMASPYLDVFYEHHAVCIVIDSGATGNMMHVSFARYIGAPIIKSSQSARQADGQSALNIVGETKLALVRDQQAVSLTRLGQ